MQIKMPQFKKQFKKEHWKVNPEGFWKIILLLSFLVIIGSFAFGFYLFMETNKEPDLSQEGINKNIETVDIKRIEKILEYFSENERKSLEIKNSPSPVVDPTL